MNIDRLIDEMKMGKDIEWILKNTDWKGFEDICAQILEKHGFNVTKHFIFKSEGRKQEIDVLARGNRMILALECKYWDIRPGKKSALITTARKHKERIEKLQLKDLIIPIIVTWFEEDVFIENGVWIVPISKLNNFVLNLDEYI